MGVKKYYLLLFLLGICYTYIRLFCAQEAYAFETQTETISGLDRYHTAVAISQKGWTSSDYAVLVRGDDFADGLSAGPLAHKYGAPLLLTHSHMLNEETLTELKRLGVKQVLIIGGKEAVSQNVEDNLRKEGITVIKRISGTNRYQTSARIAELFDPSEAALVTGEDHSDALSITAAACLKGMPILLTAKDQLPPEAQQYIASKNIAKTYIIGGTGVIDSGLDSRLPGAVRIAGRDRFETNALILDQFAGEWSFDNIYLASGYGDFTDALVGGVLAARSASPMILVDTRTTSPENNYLSAISSLEVNNHTKLTVLGTEDPISSSILESIIPNVGNLAAGEANSDYSSDSTGVDDSSSSDSGGDTTPPSAISISAQNIIPSSGMLNLSVTGGPLSDSSWEAILNHIRSNTGSEGDGWITGISGTDLSIEPSPDGTSAVLRNTGVTAGIITRDFIIPVGLAVDRSGNSSTGDIIIDSHAVVITGVSTDTIDGYYRDGAAEILINIHFSGEVEVVGNPFLEMETGESDRSAIYTGGSGSAVLTFTYNVQAGDNNPALDYVGTTSLNPGDGSIKLSGSGEDAVLTLPSPGETGSLCSVSTIVIDTVPPNAINISSQDRISARGDVTLSAVGGPLSDSSWLSIYSELKSKTRWGTWIRGILNDELSITIIEDGNSALIHNNNPIDDALIIADFIFTADKVVDRAGNTALSEIRVNSWSGD